LKALGVFGGLTSRLASLSMTVGFIACARTDFQAFDQFVESGASGSDSGGGSNGGTSTGGFAGTSITGGVAGTSVTGGVGGTGGVCRDGRELCGNQCVLIESDPNHCGGCFSTCPDYAECIRGECVPFCDGSTYCGGICTDITRDPLNCGGCGKSCGRGMSPAACIDGLCRCPGRQVDCGAGCTDLETDPGNCGRCGFPCPPDRLCVNSTCQLECPPGYTLCEGECRDLLIDAGNCGACGRACTANQQCNLGMCSALPDRVTYTVEPSPLPFVNACGQPGFFQLLGEIDDAVAALMLPFPFRFYGTSTFSAWTSSNGILGFGAPTASFQNECSGSAVRSAVLPFWDDLGTRQSGICVATLGTEPNRQWVVTWYDAFILGLAGTHLNFSVVLNEGSDIIDVLYGSMSGAGALSAGQEATVGLADELDYALDCCNEPCVTSNTGRRYVPVLR
jgi:hypothetical protein